MAKYQLARDGRLLDLTTQEAERLREIGSVLILIEEEPIEVQEKKPKVEKLEAKTVEEPKTN